MTRPSASTDYFVDVDGVGTFSFARRTMRDEMRIAAEYSRLTEGVETPTAYLELVAGMLSTLRVLTVSQPDGWNLDDLDPLDSDSYTKLVKVHNALRAKEDSFRRKPDAASKVSGPQDGADGGVRVPAPVSAGAD